jgi:hypothetical protein
MSPVVLQLLPMPPAHVAGFSFPLNSNYTVEWNSNAWCCYCPSKCYEDQTHHSHSEKKIFFPYFFMALLILVYLHEPWQFTSQSNTSDQVHWYCPICDIVLQLPFHDTPASIIAVIVLQIINSLGLRRQELQDNQDLWCQFWLGMSHQVSKLIIWRIPKTWRFAHLALHDRVILAFCYCTFVSCHTWSRLVSGSLPVCHYTNSCFLVLMQSLVAREWEPTSVFAIINWISSIPSITVDTKLQPFCVHVICKRLDSRGECLLIWNHVTLRNSAKTLSIVTEIALNGIHMHNSLLVKRLGT